MNTMTLAHQWAREHREEFPSYREALSQGLRAAHRSVKENAGAWEKRERVCKDLRPVELPKHFADPEAYAARIISEGVQKYRDRTPLLLRDWKAPNYEGRRDYRAWMQ